MYILYVKEALSVWWDALQIKYLKLLKIWDVFLIKNFRQSCIRIKFLRLIVHT